MSIEEEIREVLAEVRRNVVRRDEEADGDGGRKAAAIDGITAETRKATALDAERGAKAEADEKASLRAELAEIKAALHTYGPSKAASIGVGGALSQQVGRRKAGAIVKAHPALEAAFEPYSSGEFLGALLDIHGIDGTSTAIDIDAIPRGKALMAEFASYGGKADLASGYALVDGKGKATLGTPGSAGGFVLPNNLVDTVIKPKTQAAVYQLLVTTVNGVAVRGVDQPYRTGAPTRMVVSNWGNLKENVDEVYGTYSATLCTIARVMDIGKQYARFSAGAAEQDVMDELTRAAVLGENYYMAVGPGGTGVPGTDTPTGILTALAAGAATYNSTAGFTPAASTLLGSAAKGFTVMLGALAGRSREASAVVVDAATYWAILAQGTDAAGFFVDPQGGPTAFRLTQSGQLAFWGVPVYYDANLGTNFANAKVAIAGDWKQAKLYRGQEFRIDTSDTAGNRWDYNLIGFRAEEEIGFNPSSAVSVGAFQYLTNILP